MNEQTKQNNQPDTVHIPNRLFPLKQIVVGLLVIALTFIVAAIALPKSAEAKDAIGLNDKQTVQVHKLEKYLNAISSMRARFLQITSLGQFSQGDFLMQRPGLMRIEYDEPNPILLVSDGLWVMYKDKQLDQRSYTLLSAVPASIFIGETVDFFGDDLLISDFEHKTNVIRITLQRDDDPAEGALTLVFASKPLALKQWTVLDAQGISTTVSLLAPEYGVKLDEALFKVDNQIRKKDD